MQYLNVAAATLGSLLTLFLLTKLIGNKQMSQLNLFDYINGITIGSIAAEMATSLEDDFLKPLLAMVVYAITTLLIDLASNRWLPFRRFFEGTSIILYEKDKLYYKNFKKAKLDINEFLVQCRESGYFSLANLHCAILEPNGKLSFLPKETARPTTPSDFGLSPTQNSPQTTLIVDGKILTENLKIAGKEQQWLEHALRSCKLKQDEVFLAVCDSQNQFFAYKKEPGRQKSDRFM